MTSSSSCLRFELLLEDVYDENTCCLSMEEGVYV